MHDDTYPIVHSTVCRTMHRTSHKREKQLARTNGSAFLAVFALTATRIEVFAPAVAPGYDNTLQATAVVFRLCLPCLRTQGGSLARVPLAPEPALPRATRVTRALLASGFL